MLSKQNRTKTDKTKFVDAGKAALKKYSLVGVVPLSGIPDRLFQRSRNGMKPSTEFIMGRKTLMVKILESSDHTKLLVPYVTGTSAIVLSNENPFVLYRGFKANSLKLGAKPKQLSPEDINISAGETSIQPGQAVTELKQAGIDVQIQKGKVVIAKDKVLVKKGAVISPAVAKALKTLDIMPFSASIQPSVFLSGKIMFTKDVLGIDAAQVASDVSRGFSAAYTLSISAGIVSRYTIRPLLVKAYMSAMAVGIEGKIYEPGIVDRLLASATLQASSLNSMVKPAGEAEAK